MAYRITDYLNNKTASSNGMAQRQKQDAETRKSMLAQINATKPETLLGYGLGKLLRGAYDHSKRRSAQKDEENRRHREQLGRNSAANAGIAPVKGVLGNGFNMLGDFHAGTGGGNPIALEAYGKTVKAEKPSEEAPVVATTTELTYDPNQFSAIRAAQGTPVVTTQEPLNLTERAIQIMQPEELDPSKWNNIPLVALYGRQG